MCQRCGGVGSDWHHRRSRRVVDEHTHCPCNGVLLCRTCHAWVHGHPELAQGMGLIVSAYWSPSMFPVQCFDGREWLLDCEGNFRQTLDT